MTDFKNMFKQAQQLQSKFMEMQNQMQELQIEGSSGGGMVKLLINGKSELKKIDVDPSVLNPEDAEVLNDLIIAAFNDAKSKLETQLSEKMSSLTGGMAPAGFKLPF
ncbi:MAG: YbaB/EbfC family nucleoid-associated protein [Holosporales bacterium]|jgi:DNA-binding YbaB/EbfC family protein|nr:YbaB/EbfC family nucleoid-associated protein [Holosporales bacterium]